jgi:Glycosyl transferase family 2
VGRGIPGDGCAGCEGASGARRPDGQLAGVTVLDSDCPPGLPGARNTGLLAASGEITAFLDDDAEVRPGWLAPLVELNRSPGVVAPGEVCTLMAAPRVRLGSGLWLFELPDSLGRAPGQAPQGSESGPPRSELSVARDPGCCRTRGIDNG